MMSRDIVHTCPGTSFHLSREPVGPSRSVERRHHVARLEHDPRIRGHQEPGVIVQRVQDLDVVPSASAQWVMSVILGI